MRGASFAAGFLVLLLSGCSPKGGSALGDLAEAAGKQITAEAFARRYATFLKASSVRDNIVVRKRVLDNMVNELLIYADARAKGMDTSAELRDELDRVRLQALLVAEAKRITVDTMVITEEELRSEFLRSITRVAVRYVYGKTPDAARALKRRLEGGATFQTVAREVFADPGLATNGGYLGSFGYGEMEPALEEAAMTVPVGALSDPVRIAAGWAVIKVEWRTVQPLSSEYDYAKAKEKLARNIQERRAMAIITSASHAGAERLGAVFNDDAVDAIMRGWPSIAANRAPEMPAEEPSSRQTTLVRFAGSAGSGSWTIADFYDRLRRTTEGQRRRVKTSGDFKELVRALAVRESLAADARASGADTSAEFTAHMAEAADDLLLKRWAAAITDSVNAAGWDERVLRAAYDEHRADYAIPPERNVAEILVRTPDEASALRQKLDRGASFASLARRHSIRLWAAKEGGELGFGPRSKYGTLADTLFGAKEGTVLGPLNVDPYWGLFTVVGIRPGRPKSYDEARPDIIASLGPQRAQDVLRAHVERLRSGAPVVIHEDLLANVTLPNVTPP